MVHAVICSLAVVALFQVAASSASGSCPTLFNFYAHPTDCTKFFRCFWGSPVEFSCPAGTHWNQHILTCDHAYNVPCATAILNPIYKLVKDDGYGYQKVGYVNYDGSKGYEKGNYGYATNKGYEKGNYGYATNKGYEKGNYGYVTSKGYDKGSYGYESSKGDNKMYGGSYVRSNDYDNYGNYFGTVGYTKQTYPPSVGHNYGGFAARAGFANYNNGYARPQYVTNGYVKPNYGGYSAGGYASRAASGYARVGDPIVGRVYGKASYATKNYGGWKK
ncbi:heterogeneous nuclear ribonucleoprotein A2 homolog 1-like isoform X1 [Haliotis rufescens]|uniref:heterogeneous nuclear ribonucleoprotein A2 homolog 1-like isoform X1 n=1 Tax=Haliotis rufescens TaxID=6454 RepID=UPI00201EF074|nr:heterogeneous nuclear ribonucleoprotein A2 homolog 1-like isoform X1 [Haliotis rufescens]